MSPQTLTNISGAALIVDDFSLKYLELIVIVCSDIRTNIFISLASQCVKEAYFLYALHPGSHCR